MILNDRFDSKIILFLKTDNSKSLFRPKDTSFKRFKELVPFGSLVSRYLLEYIHPFYDENGRTGRYLLALYLDESLSIPTVLSLSRTIAENKNTYYAAFSSVENPFNHGEMTHFVYSMLELIRTAQSSMIERLQSNIEHFEQNGLSKKEREIVFILAQYDLFGMVSSLTWNSIAEIIELCKQTTRNHLKKLENKGIVQAIQKSL